MNKTLLLFIFILCNKICYSQGALTFTHSPEQSKELFKIMVEVTYPAAKQCILYFKEDQCELYTTYALNRKELERNLLKHFSKDNTKKLLHKKDTIASCINWAELFKNEKLDSVEFKSRKFYSKFNYYRDSIIKTNKMVGENLKYFSMKSMEVTLFNIEGKSGLKRYAIAGIYAYRKPGNYDRKGYVADLSLFSYEGGKWIFIQQLVTDYNISDEN